MKKNYWISMRVILFSLVFSGCEGIFTEPETGSIIISSEPSGASIYLDNTLTQNVTPDTLTKVGVGSHSLRLTLTGYDDYEKRVILSDGEVEKISAELNLQCPGGIVGNLSSLPEIKIVGLQSGDKKILGTANNVNAGAIRVVLWAKTDIWYVQPFIARPFTEICGDGSWRNSTHPWSRMVALLVDSTYTPGSIRTYHPSSDPGVLAWDEFPSLQPDRQIDFSGHTWSVKVADAFRAGPGPNYFSDSESSVWVNTVGLHLKTEKRNNKWYSAEVFLNRSLGYGEYTFQLASRVDSLDFRAVFAGFVYESASRELDIEFSKVLANPNNAQYVVQPFSRPGNITRFLMPALESSTHKFVWREDSIVFTSWRGIEENPDSVIHTWTYMGLDIPPPGGERMRFNLWLFGGRSPLGGQGDEVIISSFQYRP